jgi:hypothetical protein
MLFYPGATYSRICVEASEPFDMLDRSTTHTPSSQQTPYPYKRQNCMLNDDRRETHDNKRAILASVFTTLLAASVLRLHPVCADKLWGSSSSCHIASLSLLALAQIECNKK